ncbi:MAG TPA: PDZ domain-containing protein [Phycisphaerales bacterium]|nr:PDZ domain-containing protein [Phycisphaerales bacterium]
MNGTTNRNQFRVGRGLVSAAFLAAAPLAVASQQHEAEAHTTTMYVTKDGAQSSSVEIHVDNGQVTAKVNGKDVPQDRIRNENGRITILDEQGNPISNGFYVSTQDNAGSLGNDTYERLRQWYSNTAHAQPAPETPKVMIGISMAPIDAALAKQLQVNADDVTFVSGVYEGLPAQKAGLEEYDVITKVDGKSPASSKVVTDALANKNPGDEINFTVIQNGKPKDISIKVSAYDADGMRSAKLLGRASVGSSLPYSLYNLQMPDNWTALPSLVGPNENIMGFRPFDSGNTPRLNVVPMQPSGDTVNEKMDRLNDRMAELEKKLQRLMDHLDRQNP